MKYPSYLNLNKTEFKKRIDKAYQLLKPCLTCPRQCKVNRLTDETGFCRAGKYAIISSASPHFGEERPLVGQFGSGTIFFTHCNLACVFCQNYDTSQLAMGQTIDNENLANLMINLQSQGCHNINLVSPTPYLYPIIDAINRASKQGLQIPIIYNTNAYDSIDSLKLLNGIVDIYMPDLKYADDKIAKKYSLVDNYFAVAKKAIKEMHQQVGDLKIEKGIAKKGLLIRHLVLPNNLAGTKEIVKFISKEVSKDSFLNIMDQYYPSYKAFKYPEISRRITREEYTQARLWAKEAGLRNFL